MPDTYTSGKLGLIEPSRGAYVDTWDEPLYANWQTLEACISGTTTITLTSSNVVLTIPTFPTYTNPPSVSTSAQNLRLLLQGAPSVNLTVYIPATISGFWIIDDQTIGSATITVKTTAVSSTGITSVRDKTLIVISDGTNIKLADSGNNVDPSNLVPAGAIQSFGGTSAPTGWLSCNGAAVSRTTYAALFAAIGSTWGNGDGLTTFNIPDLANVFLRGSGSSPVATYEADGVGPLTVSDPGHTHLNNYVQPGGTGPGSGFQCFGSGSQGFATVSATTGITISNTISETRPKNRRVLYIIKT